MTFNAGGPLARRQAAMGRQRHDRRRWWLLGVIAVIVLLVVAGNGGRAWWARRLGDLTSGSRTADFLIGLAVGLLPVIAVALASLGHHRRRALRMFVAGAAGFVLSDLLAPSVTTAIFHSGGTATRPFERDAPGYLTGVYIGFAVWVLLLLVAVIRLRRAWRRRRDGYPL
jgi:ABC-type Co2+ transport system permease subunit